MTGWKITAKTIFCDTVADEVTLLVYKDGSAKCTGYQKYQQPNSFNRKLISQKSRQLGHAIKCESGQCPRLKEYQEKIFAEESK